MDISEYVGKIRVTKTPDGEAPEKIRKQWVGLEIPCLFFVDDDVESFGVLSGKPMPPSKNYVVRQEDAIDALEAKSPAASEWWGDHGFGCEEGAMFSFRSSQVEETKKVSSRQEFLDLLHHIRQLIQE